MFRKTNKFFGKCCVRTKWMSPNFELIKQNIQYNNQCSSVFISVFTCNVEHVFIYWTLLTIRVSKGSIPGGYLTL